MEYTYNQKNYLIEYEKEDDHQYLISLIGDDGETLYAEDLPNEIQQELNEIVDQDYHENIGSYESYEDLIKFEDF